MIDDEKLAAANERCAICGMSFSSGETRLVHDDGRRTHMGRNLEACRDSLRIQFDRLREEVERRARRSA